MLTPLSILSFRRAARATLVFLLSKQPLPLVVASTIRYSSSSSTSATNSSLETNNSVAGSTTTLEQDTTTLPFAQRGMCRQGGGASNKASPCPCHQKHGNDSESFHDVIQHLLDHHEQIQRRVKNNPTPTEANSPTSVESSMTAETWSEDPQVAKWIQTHVQQMMGVVARGGRVRQWDPLFVAMFDHHSEIDAGLTLTDQGVEVQMTGKSPCGRALVQAHTQTVSGFVERGRAEARLAHEVPEICQNNPSVEEGQSDAK